MNEVQEIESDLLLIDPHTWLNIPDPIIKAVDIILKTCINQNSHIKLLTKEIAIINHSKQIQQHIFENANKNIETCIQDLDEKIQTSVKGLDKKIKDTLEDTNKEINESKQKLISLQKSLINESISIKDLLHHTKELIKSDIIAKFVKPEIEIFKSEQSELIESMKAIKKQMKYLTFKLEKNSDDNNSKFSNHQEKIWNIEKSITTMQNRFDFIVEQKTEDLLNTVQSFEKRIEETFDLFNSHRENYFSDMYKKEVDLKNHISQKVQEIEENTKKVTEMVHLMGKSNEEMKRSYEKLEENVKFESERIRIETERMMINCYEKAKEKLVSCYREDVNIIKKKLEWLPQELESIKDLAPLEARLYTIESRLKREETNRIVQKIDIIKGMNY